MNIEKKHNSLSSFNKKVKRELLLKARRGQIKKMLNVECYVSCFIHIFSKRLAIQVPEYLDWQTIAGKKEIAQIWKMQ